jgi:Family of unknown function (DUF6328)
VATDEVIEQRLEEAPEDEAVKERLEREHGELLEELRALIPGAQVLFGFLLAIRFTSPFSELNTVQRDVYYATLLTTAVALVFLLAPSAYHRLRFREGDKDAMVRKGNREAIAGTGAIALAFTGVLYLITDLVFTTHAAIGVAVAFFALNGRPTPHPFLWTSSSVGVSTPWGEPHHLAQAALTWHQTALGVPRPANPRRG